METQRKFTQSISMKCTQDQYLKDLQYQLEEIGAKVNDLHDWDKYPNFTSYQVNDGRRFFTNLGSKAQQVTSKDTVKIDHYNPELFLALAAMSATDEFYPGEWVCNKETGVIYGKVEGIGGGAVKIKNFADSLIAVSPSCIRKCTVEEIKNHFLKGSFPETPLIEFDPDDIDPKSIPKNSHHIDGMEMFFSEPIKENQIRDVMWLIEKYNQPQPIGCSDNPIYNPDVVSMQDTGEVEITFNGIKYIRADAKEPQTKENQLPNQWIPYVGEPVNVRSSESDKWQKMRFLQKSKFGYFVFNEQEYEEYLSGNRFICQQFRYAEQIPKTEKIPLAELIKAYSEKYDIKPELITLK